MLIAFVGDKQSARYFSPLTPPPSAVGEKAKTKEREKRKEEREVADANSSNNNVKYGLIDLVPAPPKPSLGTPLGGANGFCRWTHREKKA